MDKIDESGHVAAEGGWAAVAAVPGFCFIATRPRLTDREMTEQELMELAVMETRKCAWPDEELEYKPKVGAVIAINQRLISSAHRDTEDHAEKRALSLVSSTDDLSEATVFTTLEPCTHAVRRKDGDSCTDRLIRARVRKVVIGILDPNQGVC